MAKIWLKMEHSNWFKRSACHVGRGFFYIRAKHAHTRNVYEMERQQSFHVWVRQRPPDELSVRTCVRVCFSLPPSTSLSMNLSMHRRVFVPISKPFAVPCVHLFLSTIHPLMYSDSHKMYLLLIEVQLRKDIQASERVM